MTKTRLEKIADCDEQIKQIKNYQKELRQKHNAQERKDRTRCLCQRMGLFESLLPGTIPLSDDSFKAFLEKTVLTEHSRRILDGLTEQNAATPIPKAIDTAQDNGADDDDDEGDSARDTA